MDMALVREKSLALTGTFMALLHQECARFGLQVITPQVAERRASQVAVRHADAFPLIQALIERGVIGDFRSPDVMRFGFAPLYIRFVDVWDAVAKLREVFTTRSYENPRYRVRAEVT